ncbi:DUF6898 family protein [Candidatus Phycosocius bacilliformis]|uniref:DUF6898 family protein n=1 Tax=Candidatus Phycosocius bacilliformis TaxID=1445552 RepID=UPI001788E221|nr:hypothetical protein [Candidatus Phycosocius bacilliformis]
MSEAGRGCQGCLGLYKSGSGGLIVGEPTAHDGMLRDLMQREIYLETQIRGPYAQVRAIDAQTGLEVAVTTPASAAQFDQKRLALRKLGQALIAHGVMLDPDRAAPTNLEIDNRPADKAGKGTKSPLPALPKRGILT